MPEQKEDKIENREEEAGSKEQEAENRKKPVETTAKAAASAKTMNTEPVAKTTPIQPEASGIVNEIPPTENEEATTTQTTPPAQETVYEKRFKTLVSKIYDRDYDLGSCFERNITFVSFADNTLTWESTAEDADRKMLITHWGVINMFVKDLFGVNTKIDNIAKKKTTVTSEQQVTGNGQPTENTEELTEKSEQQRNAVHNDADSGSMIEELEMKSSCIAPDAGNTEAAKEKDPSTLLEEPMVKTALNLLNPKKVRIKRNV